jgi:predicted transcriptional regulator of viral defense system
MPRASSPTDSTSLEQAVAVFRQHGGMLRMAEALRSGIHRRTLYALRDAGLTEQLSRGLYRLADTAPLGNPDLVTVTLKVPKGVICLVSALAFHDLTTQIPHEVYVAIPRNAEATRLDHPPVRSFRFSGLAFSEGIETHRLDGVPIRIYSREKTLADCFKYRNKIGLDTVLEALRLYKQQGRTNVDVLMRYATVCRVTRVMRPYLEAVL